MNWVQKIRDLVGNAMRRFWAFLMHTDSDDPFRMSSPARIGALGIMGFLVVFLAWASFVTLDSAVIASGVVSVEGKRKKVEHFEGGIVERVLVNDGDVVSAGQALIILSKTQSLTALDILLSEQDAVLALEARLDAELADADELKLPPELTERAAVPAAQAAISGQTKLFAQRRETFRGEIAALTGRKDQYLEIVQGLDAQIRSIARQTVLIDQEHEGIQKLYDQGLARLPNLLALKRARAALDGQKGALQSSIAENKLKASEVDVQVINIKNERLDQIAGEMRDAQRRRFELANRIKAAKDAFERTTIISPSAGTVVALAVHTQGEVVRSGDKLLEIVPGRDRLVVEAHINPDDADNVRAGTPARVRLSPFKTRAQPVVDGKVVGISADRLVDERTGMPYYLAEIEMDRAAVQSALGSATLQPGLPAEVMISLGEHTPLEYMIAPLSRRVEHAMREE